MVLKLCATEARRDADGIVVVSAHITKMLVESLAGDLDVRWALASRSPFFRYSAITDESRANGDYGIGVIVALLSCLGVPDLLYKWQSLLSDISTRLPGTSSPSAHATEPVVAALAAAPHVSEYRNMASDRDPRSANQYDMLPHAELV